MRGSAPVTVLTRTSMTALPPHWLDRRGHNGLNQTGRRILQKACYEQRPRHDQPKPGTHVRKFHGQLLPRCPARCARLTGSDGQRRYTYRRPCVFLSILLPCSIAFLMKASRPKTCTFPHAGQR